jgi:hypothetical protein
MGVPATGQKRRFPARAVDATDEAGRLLAAQVREAPS